MADFCLLSIDKLYFLRNNPVCRKGNPLFQDECFWVADMAKKRRKIL